MGDIKNFNLVHYGIPLQFEFGEVYSRITEKLNAEDKHLAPFLLQYILRTGDTEILKMRNIAPIAKKSYEQSLGNARDKITVTLAEYKIFDRKLLTIDMMNMFQLSEEDIDKILKEMESRGRVKLTASIIEQL